MHLHHVIMSKQDEIKVVKIIMMMVNWKIGRKRRRKRKKKQKW